MIDNVVNLETFRRERRKEHERADEDPITRFNAHSARINVLMRRLWPEHYAPEIKSTETKDLLAEARRCFETVLAMPEAERDL